MPDTCPLLMNLPFGTIPLHKADQLLRNVNLQRHSQR